MATKTRSHDRRGKMYIINNLIKRPAYKRPCYKIVLTLMLMSFIVKSSLDCDGCSATRSHKVHE